MRTKKVCFDAHILNKAGARGQVPDRSRQYADLENESSVRLGHFSPEKSSPASDGAGRR